MSLSTSRGEDSGAAETATETNGQGQEIGALPDEIVSETVEAIVNADMQRLLTLLDQAEEMGASGIAGWRTLANEYEYQQMLDILEQPSARH